MAFDKAVPIALCPVATRVEPVLDEDLSPPEPFDEDVVDPTSLAVHAHFASGALDSLDPLLAGRLAAQIGVEDPRGAEAL